MDWQVFGCFCFAYRGTGCKKITLNSSFNNNSFLNGWSELLKNFKQGKHFTTHTFTTETVKIFRYFGPTMSEFHCHKLCEKGDFFIGQWANNDNAKLVSSWREILSCECSSMTGGVTGVGGDVRTRTKDQNNHNQLNQIIV